MPYALECTNLSKAFNGHAAVRQVSLTLRAGRLLALLGPSGGGKTTTLRLIAGFEWPDSGTIRINGRLVAGESARVPAEERRVGMVFQEYALFPHLDAAANIAFGLRSGNKQRRVQEMLHLVGLENYAHRMPYELSGGQQQRIALARALAPQPDILLLDEPFSNLDTALRAQVRAEVRSILKAANITGVFVTHDQEEALSLADEVAVILDGQVAQAAEPQQLYRHPTSRAVAEFVGESNFLPGQTNAAGTQVTCVLGELPLERATHGAVNVLIRPEALRLEESDGYMRGEITWREFYGHDQRIGVKLAEGTPLVARADSEQRFTPGQQVSVRVLGSVIAFKD